MQRILLVKTSSLGDVIHNLPVINDIHTHYPQANIDWLVEEGFADIPKLHIGIDQVLTVAIRRWRKQLFNKATYRAVTKCKRAISAQSYDLVIDTQGLLKSAIIACWANGKKHGLDKQSAREKLASLFYNQTHNVPRGQHAVQRNRALAALACGYAMPNNAPDYGLSKQNIVDLDIDFKLPKPFIIGLHGTSRDSKLWPTEHWIDLGRQLAARHLSLVLPWASNAEHERTKTIASSLNNVHALPKQSIKRLASIIVQAHAAVGVDTGLSHLAVALNTPTVAIYTDTNPLLTGVYPGRDAAAFNLGNIAQIPSVANVINGLVQAGAI